MSSSILGMNLVVGSAENEQPKMSVGEVVDKLIADNDIMVFAKSYCPHCKQTKSLLQSIGYNHRVFEIDLEENGAAVQEYLLEKTRQRTVPNTFVKGQHVGGNDALQAAHKDGTLKRMYES